MNSFCLFVFCLFFVLFFFFVFFSRVSVVVFYLHKIGEILELNWLSSAEYDHGYMKFHHMKKVKYTWSSREFYE